MFVLAPDAPSLQVFTESSVFTYSSFQIMALLFLLLVRVASSRPDLHNLPEVMSFADWKIAFERKYADAEDEAFRARAFADNVKRIQHHNAHGSKSYRLGVNKFSDLTPEEFRTQYLQTSVMAAPARRNETDAWLNTTDLGSTIDWRTKVRDND